jgi:hypothetical protein
MKEVYYVGLDVHKEYTRDWWKWDMCVLKRYWPRI